MIAGDRFYLGHLGKTPVYIVPEAAFSLLLVWMWSDKTVPGFVITLMSFVTVILIHESGHALLAHLSGMQGVSITLAGMGGYCSYGGVRRLASELWISLAGPFANLLTAGGLWLLFTFAAPALRGLDDLILYYLSTVLLMSLVLGCFNLLPIYPLDGGQATLAAARMVARNDASARRFTLSVAVAAVIPALLAMHLLGFGIGAWTLILIALLLMSAFRDLR